MSKLNCSKFKGKKPFEVALVFFFINYCCFSTQAIIINVRVCFRKLEI